MKRFIRPVVAPLALFVGVVASTGCGASPDPDPTAASAQALNAPAGAATEAPGRPHMRGRGGPMAIFHEALSELDLSTDQKAKIQTAFEDAKPERGENREQGKAVFTEIADGVRAGKVDEAAIQKKLEALAAEHADGPAKMATAFQTLHDTLTADQRAKLVATIKAKMEAHERGEGGRHEAHGPPPEGAGPPFLHGIELRDDQRTKIDQALADAGLSKPEGRPRFEDMRDKMKASLDAFASDKFDAKATFTSMGPGPADHVGKLAKALAVVVPLLDDAQRAKLADNLAEGPMGPMRGHHGPDGEPPAGAP